MYRWSKALESLCYLLYIYICIYMSCRLKINFRIFVLSYDKTYVTDLFSCSMTNVFFFVLEKNIMQIFLFIIQQKNSAHMLK